MLSVLYDCVAQRHDLRLVALAAFICVFASFTATNLCHRANAASRGRHVLWIAGAAMVFGCGVWATHFVAELAYRPGLPVGFDASLTALSALIAVVLTGLGIAVASRVQSTLGGGLVGLAIVAMHYTGMGALRAPAVFHWDVSYVVVSIILSVVFAGAAFRVMALGSGLRLRVAAALLLVLGVVGLHFMGMSGLTLAFDPSVPVSPTAIAPELMATAVAGVTTVVITIGLSGAVADDQMARQAKAEATLLARRVEERTAELEALQAELVGQERIATMGQLTATVAHELRNPLSAVRNSLYVIRETMAAHGIDLDRALNRAERNVVRCDRIITDLLEFARAPELKPAPIVADRWFAQEIETYPFPSGITVARDFKAPGVIAALDADRMRRAIGNLLDNSAQALAETPGERRIVVASRVVGETYEVIVADNGPGIGADDLPRIFEPFFSTKSFGTGLGLPAVQQVLAQHGGSVTIESAVGDGTTVRLLLPIAAAAGVPLAEIAA